MPWINASQKVRGLWMSKSLVQYMLLDLTNKKVVHISHSSMFPGWSGCSSNSEHVRNSPPLWGGWTLKQGWSFVHWMEQHSRGDVSIPQHKIIWATAHSCRSSSPLTLLWPPWPQSNRVSTSKCRVFYDYIDKVYANVWTIPWLSGGLAF